MLTEDTENEHFERLAEIRSKLCAALQGNRRTGKAARPGCDHGKSGPYHRALDQNPATKIKAQEYEQIRGLGDRLRKHIVGQDQAVDAVARAIRRNRVGISPSAVR